MSEYVITDYCPNPDFCNETVLSGLGEGWEGGGWSLCTYVHTYAGSQTSRHIHQYATDEAQLGRKSCLWLFHLLFGMIGEAITGPR